MKRRETASRVEILFRSMKLAHLSTGDRAPDFSLPDYRGSLYMLSEIYSRQNVLLVFNLGFA